MENCMGNPRKRGKIAWEIQGKEDKLHGKFRVKMQNSKRNSANGQGN